MRRRRFAMLLAVSTLLLTACGSGSDQAGGEGSGDEVTIRYALWEQRDQEAMEAVAAAFEETHPNVQVELEITPWEQYWTKLQTAASGGEIADVFWMNPLEVKLYAKGGVIEPLEDRVAEAGVDLSKFPAAITDTYRYDGKLYGLPRDMAVTGLWYNKELFDKAGLDYPDASWTWDDVISAAKELTDPATGQYGMLSYLNSQASYYNTIPQAGGHVIAPDGERSGYDDPAAIEGLQFWVDLIHKYHVSPSLQTMTDTAPDKLFQTGKVGMWWAGSWMATTFWANTEMRSKIDVAPLPSGPERKAVVFLGLANVVSAGSEHKDVAWELVRFMSSEEAQRIQAESGGASIPVYEGTQDAWFESFPGFHMNELFEQSLPHGVPYPVSLNTAKWAAVEQELLVDAWTGSKPVAEVAGQIADQMNQILAEES